MKKIAFGIMLSLAALAGCKSGSAYEINGAMADNSADGTTVYLYEYATREVADSATVANGAYSFIGEAKTPAAYYIVPAGSSQRIILILEPGVINIDMSEGGNISGTPLNDIYNEYSRAETVLSNEVEVQFEKVGGIEIIFATQDYETYAAIMTPYEAAVDSLNNAYFEANRDNAVGALMLSNIYYSVEPEEFERMYNESGPAVRNDKNVAGLMEKVSNMKLTAEGQPFADFTIENGNPDGGSVSLSDYVGRGKYVLVDFWASWCGPCIAEIPVLEEVYEKHAGDRFEILSVAVWDKRADTEKAIGRYGFAWPQILDAQSVPTDLYGIDGIPHIILFGPDGTILRRELRGDELKTAVAEALE